MNTELAFQLSLAAIAVMVCIGLIGTVLNICKKDANWALNYCFLTVSALYLAIILTSGEIEQTDSLLSPIGHLASAI